MAIHWESERGGSGRRGSCVLYRLEIVSVVSATVICPAYQSASSAGGAERQSQRGPFDLYNHHSSSLLSSGILDSLTILPQRQPRSNAIVPDLDALLASHRDSTGSEHTPTGLRPPPRGPKKTRPRKLVPPGLGSAASSPTVAHPNTSRRVSSYTPLTVRSPLPAPPLSGSSFAIPAVSPFRSQSPVLEDHEQVLVVPPRSDSLLFSSNLPPSSPLSPFNPHHTAAPPADLPVDIDLSALSDSESPTTKKLSLVIMSKYDGSDGEPSPVQFAPPPDDDDSDSSSSTESIPKVKSLQSSRDSSPLPQVKRRPPALQRRSSSNDAYRRSSTVDMSPHSGTSGLGISVSSTIYPISAIGRHSFIDLDDTTPTLDTHLGRSTRPRKDASHPNAMYPTPTRAAFRPHSRADTVGSDTSQLPMFAQPGAGDASYQPVAPKERRRPRPQSMLISPTSSANDSLDSVEASALKPPLPKGPKPAQFLRKAAAASNPSSPKEYSSAQQQPLPPTTNTRDPGERQELVRKHRKLAQMFGEGVTGMLRPNDLNAARARVRGPLPPSSHRKGSHSADTNEEGRGQLLIIGPVRRHSTPTSGEFGEYAKMVRSDGDTNGKPGLRSPASFMELSDDESEARKGDDVSSVLTYEPEVTAERDRKKMRDKLAKLHRFLGSRVPVELALGAEYALKDQDLPKPAPAAVSPVSDKEGDAVKDGGKKWKRRRRSSSSAALPGYVVVPPPSERRPPEDNPDERIKDELGDKERALHLKRANKMEQMFGTRPPPTLYQTRPASSSASKPLQLNTPMSEPFLLPVVDLNVHASSHKGKAYYGKRPGTGESSQALLAEDRDRLSHSISPVYMHYRHSLNSLTDIIDKDDKASLAELHQYINGPSSSDDEAASVYPASPSASIIIGHSLERRRSLPARTSLISIASSISIPPAPDPGGFQQRRRRAAKLTNFFGVNYRDLFGDVLDSIEMGMREDVYAGSLREEELEELMRKLRKLKTRRDEIVS